MKSPNPSGGLDTCRRSVNLIEILVSNGGQGTKVSEFKFGFKETDWQVEDQWQKPRRLRRKPKIRKKLSSAAEDYCWYHHNQR